MILEHLWPFSWHVSTAAATTHQSWLSSESICFQPIECPLHVPGQKWDCKKKVPALHHCISVMYSNKSWVELSQAELSWFELSQAVLSGVELSRCLVTQDYCSALSNDLSTYCTGAFYYLGISKPDHLFLPIFLPFRNSEGDRTFWNCYNLLLHYYVH